MNLVVSVRHHWMLKSEMYNLLSARYLVKVVGQRGKVSRQMCASSGKALNRSENRREL